MIDTKAILEHIKSNQPFLAHNFEIFEIIEGDLYSRLMREVRNQLLSDRAFSVAQKLIPPINIIKRLTEKLTQIYTNPPTRTTAKKSDQVLMDYYVSFANVNQSFEECNRFYNAQKVGSVEPFLNRRNEPMIRPLSGHQFLPFSNDFVDPTDHTAFIKFVGNKSNQNSNTPVYFVNSDTEFIAIDGNGEKVSEYAQTEGVNPYGIIPQTYVRKTKNLLIPKPDTDLLKMGLLIPSMLTHLNFAIKMQTHSIIYGIDVDATNLEINPDAFWSFKSDISGTKPEIGTIKPQVDIAEVQSYIFGLLNMWFESRGLRVGESQGNQNSLSGIALMIKEMDVSADYSKQAETFQKAEKEFWDKLHHVHNYWVDSGKISGMPRFTDEFDPTIQFEEISPSEDSSQMIDNQIKMVKEALTSRKRARQLIHSDLSAEELEELEDQIDEEFGIKEPTEKENTKTNIEVEDGGEESGIERDNGQQEV